MAPISIPWGYTTLPIPAALISMVISIFLITYNKLSTNLQLNSNDRSISCQGDTKKNLRICCYFTLPYPSGPIFEILSVNSRNIWTTLRGL